MIFDERGLPRDTGATDWMDSARLIGMMVLFNHPEINNLRIADYFNYEYDPVRYLYGKGLEIDPKDFSRDQMVPFIAGCKKAGINLLTVFCIHLLEKCTFTAPNGDFLSPSVKNHMRLCAGFKGTWLGYQWLKLDIWYNAKFTPDREPNQLIALCMIAGPEWVKRYKDSCDWKKAIRLYWDGWRGEREFAEYMIDKMESV